ncbi:MAG: NADH-quinone oxidoreductase subunit N [Firmicutes bacterium]|nr:NADH-quinone oxidoreductase subunit N [Bacillota bacterium]
MRYLIPEVVVAGGALLALLAIVLVPKAKSLGSWIVLLALLAAGIDAATMWHVTASLFMSNTLAIDQYSILVTELVLLAGVSSLLLAWNADRFGEEFPVLLALSVIGMMTLGAAANLLAIFIGIELLSLPLYILAASSRTQAGGEAALKYLLLGAFSSGILLFGMALLYGATSTLSFVAYPAITAANTWLLWSGLALVIVGIAFKLAIVPFHMWVPDVYEGSPTPVTNFMAFGTKVGAAVILLRLLAFGFYTQDGSWGTLIGYLAVLTMIVGNLLALPQMSLKRLLGYSGIGHAGFLLVGIATHSVDGAEAMMFYLLPYGLAVMAVFGVLRLIEGNGDEVTLSDLKGMAYRQPWLAAVLIVGMLSFAGIPLTGGFVGKFFLLQAALFASQPGLAVGIVVGTLVGLFAYLRPLQMMFQRTEPSEKVQKVRWTVASVVVLTVAVVGTIGLGVYPEPFVHIVSHSADFYWLTGG